MKLKKCFEFTGEERFFQGHFPEAPILPGVVQLEFAHRLAEELLHASLSLKAVKKMKFVNVVQPKDTIEIEVSSERESAPADVSYTIFKGDAVCSSGVLVY